ncbi:cysteine-rich venom protein [Conger conger]|uniref:cysteine-rich venom protein n=1 Tax=Conger conger TaxID=82655 RepID=UPI002A5AA307|nr:cysteine-rich venom protein [Conger conger]
MSGFAFTAVLLALLQASLTQGQLVSSLCLTPGEILTSEPAVQKEIVDGHNAVRSGVQPTASNMLKIEWNTEAAAHADSWAKGCSMGHSTHNKRIISTSACGENIYLSSEPDSWSSALSSWHSEVNGYKYGVGQVGKAPVGHYTQMVWYRSNQVGCAVAHCPDSKFQYFYVCQYCPPGNFVHTNPYTEGPSCGQCPDNCDNNLCTNPCPFLDKYANCGGLKNRYGCGNKFIATWCPASCQCAGKII